MTRLLLAITLIAALSGCEHRINEGEIYAHGHLSEQTVMIMMPLTTCSGGKVITCRTMFIPMFFHYPERWYIDIRKYEEEKWLTSRWWVSQDVFNQAQVGGYFKVDEKKSLSDEPRQRVEKDE